MPRVPCPRCERDIAAKPAGVSRVTVGLLWRHDDPESPRIPGSPLVSCLGSHAMVTMPGARQLDLPFRTEPEPEAQAEQVEAQSALF